MTGENKGGKKGNTNPVWRPSCAARTNAAEGGRARARSAHTLSAARGAFTWYNKSALHTDKSGDVDFCSVFLPQIKLVHR